MKKLQFLGIVLLLGCQAAKPLIQSSCSALIDSAKLPVCPPDIICTSEYRTIIIQVEDKKGNPVELDHYQLENLTLEKVIEIESPTTDVGYTIAEDLMMFELDDAGHCIQLSGWIDDQLVLQFSFLVGHDCCHVQLLAGEQTITI